jgi:hypothetical protein
VLGVLVHRSALSPEPYQRSMWALSCGEGRPAVLFLEGRDARSAEDNLRQRGVLRCPSTRQAMLETFRGRTKGTTALSRSCLMGRAAEPIAITPSELPHSQRLPPDPTFSRAITYLQVSLCPPTIRLSVGVD